MMNTLTGFIITVNGYFYILYRLVSDYCYFIILLLIIDSFYLLCSWCSRIYNIKSTFWLVVNFKICTKRDDNPLGQVWAYLSLTDNGFYAMLPGWHTTERRESDFCRFSLVFTKYTSHTLNLITFWSLNIYKRDDCSTDHPCHSLREMK